MNEMVLRGNNHLKSVQIQQYLEIKLIHLMLSKAMLGNCYFLATLSAMAENPERVKARFYTKEVNQAGIYLMSFS
jgi:hypothetical protein